MTFNFNEHVKQAQVKPYEKYLRDDSVEGEADDKQPVVEKMLPDREGDKVEVAERMISEVREDVTDDTETQERRLDTAESQYDKKHRDDSASISVPPLAVVVEKLRQERMADWKTDKQPNWTLEFDDKKQLGDLPRFPKSPGQHTEIALENDPRRFESGGDLRKQEKAEPKPLSGDFTTADVDRVTERIKIGKSRDFDAAIAAVLCEAEDQRRELTEEERQAIVQLKIARTEAMVKEG